MDETLEQPRTEAAQPFDLQERACRFAEIQDCLPELLSIFRDTAPRNLAELAQALDGEDLQAAARVCHSLKGMAAVVCARVVARAAADLETAARARDLHASRELLRPLSRAVAQALDSPHCL